MKKALAIYQDDIGKLILRISIGGLMLFHGWAKLVGETQYIFDSLQEYGLPSFLFYGVFVGECLAPLMILLGLYVRFAAILYVVNMTFTILLMYSRNFFSLNSFGGWVVELNLLYLLGALALVFIGGGRFCIKHER